MFSAGRSTERHAASSGFACRSIERHAFSAGLACRSAIQRQLVLHVVQLWNDMHPFSREHAFSTERTTCILNWKGISLERGAYTIGFACRRIQRRHAFSAEDASGSIERMRFQLKIMSF